MRPLAEFPVALLRGLRGVLFDIDDTLTTGGHLTAAAYAAMERLHEAGLLVVPVSGRPAGWCDHIARMWPVDGVVGENGAFYFYYRRTQCRMERRFMNDAAMRVDQREQLRAIGATIIKAVPGAAIAADQAYRETDLAIDFCEDVPRLSDSAIDRIVEIMREHGLTAKVSSIHVNGWYGTYDKLSMARALMSECHGVELAVELERYVFIGDSPNDAPMFAFFPNSIGVANVGDFRGRMPHEPRYVASGRAGEGFREAADCILAARS